MPRMLVIAIVFTALLTPTAHSADRALIIELNNRDLQQTIDAAPPHSTILCDPNHQLTIPTPITINKPLTLKGLCAKLPDKLGKSPLLIVKSKGVTLTDFNLTGNIDSVPQSDRAPLIVIAAGEFRVENGRLANSSKDGINIDGGFLGPDSGDIVGGVVRDITATNIARDVVSISGSGGTGQKIRNVLVDNIAAYTSSHRGCVEVSDGAEHITVRKSLRPGLRLRRRHPGPRPNRPDRPPRRHPGRLRPALQTRRPHRQQTPRPRPHHPPRHHGAGNANPRCESPTSTTSPSPASASSTTRPPTPPP